MVNVQWTLGGYQVPDPLIATDFTTMHTCLSCKGRISSVSTSNYSGDFCSEYCFSTYPGNIRRMLADGADGYQSEQNRNTVERILNRNRDILKAFRSWKRDAAAMSDIGPLQWLREKGFEFDYHTHMTSGTDGLTEVWCYDIGYRVAWDGTVEPI